MKKGLTLMLTLLMTACLLTGCVSSETNVKIGYTGKIELEMTTLLQKDVLQSQIGAGQDLSAYLDQWIAQQVSANDEYLVEDNENLVMEKVEAAGENGDMYGAYMKVSYKDWNQFKSSAFFNQFAGAAVPLTGGYLAEDKGIKYETEASPFGSTYKILGSFTMDDVFTLNGASDAENMKNAKITFKISAPLWTATSNSLNRSPFRTTHIWEVAEGGTMTVDFKAFVPNIAVLVESIIILAMLIAIIVMAVIIKNHKKSEEEITEIEGQLSMDDTMMDTESENFFEYEEIPAESDGEDFGNEELEEMAAEETADAETGEDFAEAEEEKTEDEE